MNRVLLACLLLLAACGGNTATVVEAPSALPKMSLREAPLEASTRTVELKAFGQLVFDAFVAGEPMRIVVPESNLGDLVDEKAATQFVALRVALPSKLRLDQHTFRELPGTSVSGVCLQGALTESPSGPHGLHQKAWVFQRVLLVTKRADKKRMAFWVEGDFVLTNLGFRALDIERIEEPRWEHSDLEIAQCDVEFGMDR